MPTRKTMPHLTSRTLGWGRVVCLVLALATIAAGAAQATEILRNDGFESGGFAAFQSGFVVGETAAVRLVPSVAGAHDLQDVHFLLGGSTAQITLTLKIWRDTGTVAPGALLFSGDYLVSGSDTAFQAIDLSGENIQVDGPFRVGLTFQHNGAPGPARDGDGINSALNFIDAQGIGWVQSSLLGVTGDWIIRATVNAATTYTVGGNVSGLTGSLTLSNNVADVLVIGADGPYTFAAPLGDGAAYSVQIDSEPTGQDCLVAGGSGNVAGADVTDVQVTCIDESTVRSNDGWQGGLNAAFQAGFVSGEIAAARLDPGGPGLRRITGVHFLFGGAVTSHTVQVVIWDDAAGTDTPGAVLFSQPFLLTGQLALQGLDLSGFDIQVSGPYRVGLTFTHAGLPAAARDDDGTVASDRNFIYTAGTWARSSLLGVTGDWIVRAVDAEVVSTPTLAITTVTDLPNDQGRQVRLRWNAASQDVPGGIPTITGYALFRRIDPGLKGQPARGSRTAAAYPPGEWEYLVTVPAFQEASYATVLPTVADSTITGGMHYTAFFVRATTSAPGLFFDSEPDSGYSVDNLAPQTPQNLLVVFSPGQGNDLSWSDPADADFQYFKIYRGAVPDFTVVPGGHVQTTVTAAWRDGDGDPGSYYRVTGVDFAGNESAPSASLGVSAAADRVPGHHLLGQNFPNPFNPRTSIGYRLGAAATVALRVFDSRGFLVRTLVSGSVAAGDHVAVWDGADDRGLAAGSGVYFYRLQVGEAPPLTRRMTLLK